MMIDYLTEHGTMSPKLLYESPYTNFNPKGVDGVFGSVQVYQLFDVLREVRERAAA